MPLSRVHRRWVIGSAVGALAGALCAALRPTGGGKPSAAASAASASKPPRAMPSVIPETSPPARAILPAHVQERPPAEQPAGPRVHAKTRFVWIRERPEWSSQWLGYLWPGDSVALRSPKPIYARGCDTWYAVLPRGYVCVDRSRATLDSQDPGFTEVSAHTPDPFSPSPYGYAQSLGAPRYEALPDPAEQRAREPDLEQHLSLLERARHGETRDPTLAGVDLTPATEDAVTFASLPVELQIRRRELRRDSTIAFVGQYRHGERSFLLTPDFVWVPKDRVRPFAPVTFHGVRLGGDVTLPIAFFRERPRPAYRRTDSGAFEPEGRTFPRLGWVGLTGRSEIGSGATYLETREAGLWLLQSDAVVPRQRELTPWGARVGAPDVSKNRPRGRATWIDTSVYGGWLVAYEDTEPVFATLVAPGRGGAAPADAENLTETSSTPTGIFPISGKFVSATMDGPENVTHADVPWVQNFRGPHALHAAYWHDAWGERVSGGCVNVSPEDGRFLFEFTEPVLPEGWHGVRWTRDLDPPTLVVVHP